MFSTDIRINFFDADPAGIMFFANIFRLAHSAYEEMITSAGFERDYFFDEEYAIPILHADVDFVKPMFPGSVLSVEIAVKTVKDTSFELQYHFKNEDGELTARLRTVHVFITRSDWEKSAIPSEFLGYLLMHMEQ